MLAATASIGKVTESLRWFESLRSARRDRLTFHRRAAAAVRGDGEMLSQFTESCGCPDHVTSMITAHQPSISLFPSSQKSLQFTTSLFSALCSSAATALPLMHIASIVDDAVKEGVSLSVFHEMLLLCTIGVNSPVSVDQMIAVLCHHDKKLGIVALLSKLANGTVVTGAKASVKAVASWYAVMDNLRHTKLPGATETDDPRDGVFLLFLRLFCGNVLRFLSGCHCVQETGRAGNNIRCLEYVANSTQAPLC
jgi:hypothetical protein